MLYSWNLYNVIHELYLNLNFFFNNCKTKCITCANQKAEIIKVNKKLISCLQKTHLRFKNKNRLKVEGWEMIYSLQLTIRKLESLC